MMMMWYEPFPFYPKDDRSAPFLLLDDFVDGPNGDQLSSYRVPGARLQPQVSRLPIGPVQRPFLPARPDSFTTVPHICRISQQFL
jgi:hypothetical protein